jgi:hypothetical protein
LKTAPLVSRRETILQHTHFVTGLSTHPFEDGREQEEKGKKIRPEPQQPALKKIE